MAGEQLAGGAITAKGGLVYDEGYEQREQAAMMERADFFRGLVADFFSPADLALYEAWMEGAPLDSEQDARCQRLAWEFSVYAVERDRQRNPNRFRPAVRGRGSARLHVGIRRARARRSRRLSAGHRRTRTASRSGPSDDPPAEPPRRFPLTFACLPPEARS